MEQLINYMNTANGKSKILDATETTDKLYQKYGDNAYALLQKAIQKPTSCINSINDNNLKTSRDVVQHLCNMPNNPQNQQIVMHILNSQTR